MVDWVAWVDCWKITSVNWGYFFYKTLNFLLIWSLVLSILVEIIVKSLPYSLSNFNKVLISLELHMAIDFLSPFFLVISFSFTPTFSSKAISSMTVDMVDTDKSMLRFSWLWNSSTVMQKTLPTVPEPEETARLVEVHCHVGVNAWIVHGEVW